jgi:4-amino-4-deoxy-L-arabinose transferase-like glycosyltransferase
VNVGRANDRSSIVAAVLIAAAFFVATAPTLAWLEFSSSMENLNVATALEIRREHRWMLPTLETEARVAKPPLAAWVAAGSVRASTLARLDEVRPGPRAAAYRRLALEVRWTALLCSCLMLLAVFDLGRTIGGTPVGLTAMIVCGSSLYLLRFGRQATTDVQLALWVSVANAAIARLLLRGPSWGAAAVAGIALGLALMSKGPVALLQTIVPACVFTSLFRPVRISVAQVALVMILMMLVGGSWYAYVFARVPGVWERWRIELTRAGPGEKSGNPLSYLSLLAYMLPWTAVLIDGIVRTGVETARRKFDGMTLALLMLLVPIVAMSFFPDRKERYLLPLSGPASVLAARGIAAMLDRSERRKVPPWVQWAIVGVIAVGLPVAGAFFLKRFDGATWYTPVLAACGAVVAVMVLLIAALQSRRHPFALVIGPAVVMLIMQPIFLFGYRDTREGRSEMRPLAEAVWQAAPDARMFNWRPEGPKRADVALSIYLNRPTIWIRDPADVPPGGEHPPVMITLQRSDRPPRQLPPDWLVLDDVPHDKDRYVAFVRIPH